MSQPRAIQVLTSGTLPVIRVPDLGDGIHWWKQRARVRVTLLGSTDGLDLALLTVRGGPARGPFVVIGGPGAMECTATSLYDASTGYADAELIPDPWGNALPVRRARGRPGIATGATAGAARTDSWEGSPHLPAR
jgi:hypothetical protein